MEAGDTIGEYREKGERLVKALAAEFYGMRANRAHAGLIEDIAVDYYGARTPLKHLAVIQVKPPREISVQVWDEGAIAPAAKAIETSGLGLMPNVQGNVLRMFLPELSSERREELLKLAGEKMEECRVRIRAARDEFRKSISEKEKGGMISKDEKFRMENETQKVTDRLNGEIEGLFKKKKAEIEE